MQLRDYTYLGLTQSVCPECLSLVQAKIIEREGRVYFRKHCPTHGTREDFVCSDVKWFDRYDYSVPGKIPARFGIEPARGCPYDCGLCTDHEQHTCIGLLEITSSCNLTCPVCFAISAPGGVHMPLEDCRRAIDRLVEVEGEPEILQLSGGEPTVHPQFLDIFDYACSQPIDYVMINTNGIRLARDLHLVEHLATHNRRIEIYFQLDGLSEESSLPLRGEPLLETKLRALENLAAADIRVTLVTTLQPDVNDDQIGALLEFGRQHRHITSVSFQPATYTGRYMAPEQLDRRITFPDVIQAAEQQTSGSWKEADFMPLPCAHPNGHTIAYAYRTDEHFLPLGRFIDPTGNLDLLANGIALTREKSRELIEQFIARGCCGGNDCCSPAESEELVTLSASQSATPRQTETNLLSAIGSQLTAENFAAASEFFQRALACQLGSSDLFRITTTSFMDAYNFDVRQVMKSCVHHVLPSGHLIPFSAYNVFYREGHVPLPELDLSQEASNLQFAPVADCTK